MISYPWLNTLRPRQNGRHFADDILKRIFFNENVWIAINISLKFVPKGPIYKIPALVQVMAWHRPGDKPLSEPMLISLPTHICVTRPQWVNARLQYWDLQCINPLRPRDSYKLHQTRPSLVQIMSCRLCVKPLYELMLGYYWNLANIFQWNFNQNTTIFFY